MSAVFEKKIVKSVWSRKLQEFWKNNDKSNTLKIGNHITESFVLSFCYSKYVGSIKKTIWIKKNIKKGNTFLAVENSNFLKNMNRPLDNSTSSRKFYSF